MIGHAPKKDSTARQPRPDADDKRPEGAAKRSFSGPDSGAPPHPDHNRPLWDQYPETD